jgi:hypothetical protein
MKRLRQLLCMCLGFIAAQVQADTCRVQTRLSATSVVPEAVCKVSLSLAKSRSSLMLNVQGLPPLGTYQVKVDGIERGSFSANSHGAGMLIFYAPSLSSRPRLDFDPRGKRIQVLRSGQVLCEGVLSGVGEQAESEVIDAALLAPVVAQVGSRAAVTFHRTKQGGTSLTVAVSGVANTAIQVFLEGHALGVIQPHAGQGVLLLRSGEAKPPWLPLKEDPRSKGIDLFQAGELVFSGRVLALGLGATLSQPIYLRMPMQASAATQATGMAELIVSSRAVQDFRLRLKGLAPGSYDLLVNGLKVQSFEANSVETLLRFSSQPMLEERLLAFSPYGAELRVQRANEVQLSLLFQPELLQTMPKPETAMRLSEQLTSTGASSVAEAMASYTVNQQGVHEWTVKLSHAPAGIYRLRVGSVVRSVIRCDGSSAETKGQTEFCTVPESGKLLLYFDPRGQMIEILDLKGNALFSHWFGMGSAKLTDRVLIPQDWRLPLFAESEAKGVAEVHYRRSLHEECFCLQLKGALDGLYQMHWGEQLLYEFQVQDGNAQVTFSSEQHPEILNRFTMPRVEGLKLHRKGALMFQRNLLKPHKHWH